MGRAVIAVIGRFIFFQSLLSHSSEIEKFAVIGIPLLCCCEMLKGLSEVELFDLQLRQRDVGATVTWIPPENFVKVPPGSCRIAEFIDVFAGVPQFIVRTNGLRRRVILDSFSVRDGSRTGWTVGNKNLTVGMNQFQKELAVLGIWRVSDMAGKGS